MQILLYNRLTKILKFQTFNSYDSLFPFSPYFSEQSRLTKNCSTSDITMVICKICFDCLTTRRVHAHGRKIPAVSYHQKHQLQDKCKPLAKTSTHSTNNHHPYNSLLIHNSFYHAYVRAPTHTHTHTHTHTRARADNVE